MWGTLRVQRQFPSPVSLVTIQPSPWSHCKINEIIIKMEHLSELRSPLVVAVRRPALQQQSQRHAEQQRAPQVPVPQQSRAALRVQDVDELVPHRPQVPQDGLLHRLVQGGELVVPPGGAHGHGDVSLHRDVLRDGHIWQPGERSAGLVRCRHFTWERRVKRGSSVISRV